MDVAELQRQVEYKFAPEPLLAVQALANTYSFEDDEERLLNPASAKAWLVESGLAEPRVKVDRSDFERLVAFRELIRGLLETHLDTDRAIDARGLSQVVAEHPVPLAAADDGTMALDLRPADSVDGVISQMVGIAFDSQTREQWRRLKICASDDCRWAFYDASKNRGGTWCQMEVCGNRVKNRRYRAKR